MRSCPSRRGVTTRHARAHVLALRSSGGRGGGALVKKAAGAMLAPWGDWQRCMFKPAPHTLHTHTDILSFIGSKRGHRVFAWTRAWCIA